MYLVVGLGNPGEEFTKTRHNIGFRVVDELSQRYNLKLKNSKVCNCLYAKINKNNHDIILLKPQTFMNNSGISVVKIKKKYSIRTDCIIVVHDEIDLPFGKIKIKFGGGTAGHNGLKSIVEHIGSNEFIRIRIGIGKPQKKEEVAEYVLSQFNSEERKHLNFLIKTSADLVESIILNGLNKTMNVFNKNLQTCI